MKYDCVKRRLSSIFSRIGYQIGRHPLPFVVVPLILTLCMVIGFINIAFVIDIEYLFIPDDARSRTDRDALETLFPPGSSDDFDLLKVTRFGRMASIIATPKRNESMLDETIIEELIKLDRVIRNVSINWNSTIINYEELCAKNLYKECYENFALTLRGKEYEIKNGLYNIKYPIQKTDGEPIIPAVNLGNVQLDENNYLRDFRAVRLFYPLNDTTEERERMALKWENEFLIAMSDINFRHIDVSLFVAKAFDEELSRITEMALPLLGIMIPVILLFASISTISTDLSSSKPWIGVAGCASAALSTVTAFGLLLLCGIQYVDLNLSIVFLMLGIGIDDSFVLLASWRRTNRNDRVEKRMSEAYSEAAVSITLTSVTNFLSFCMGLTVPYRVIRIFSVYSALSVLLDYIYQIFFFGGFMALEGYREEKNLHPLSCFSIKSSSTEHASNSKRNELKPEENFIMVFFRDVLAKYLQKTYVKIIVYVAFVSYLGGGIYCMRFIKEGLDYNNIFPSSSYIVNYMVNHYKFFTVYPHRIHLVFNQTLDYSNPEVQNDIENLLNTYESSPFMGDRFTTECWLREFLDFVNEPYAKISFRGYNLSNSEEFIEGVKNVYLKFKSARRFEKDILFNSEGTQIVASRCFIQSYKVSDSSAERFMMENVRRISDNSKYRTFVYNVWFVFYDQYLNVSSTCIQTICVTALLISVVFVFFIPNFKCAVCVTITIASIEAGVIGYMSLWNVNIDAVSLIILVMSTGFCVDYSAHISYAYVCCKEKDLNERMKFSLYAAGYPILQGCVTTILGVSVLYFGPSYLFVIFFKMICLVMILACFHGLILLPVVLNTGDFIWNYLSERIRKKKEFS
ncbi:patched domain-containing protein 3-like [Centruroides sculpturatus]|uniref:patched domain-containing protein 3-like n=1 Tax=Centruroides sculpturatus TaxID=218467 RepID=UPI000C6D2797|nr:patched domain-containing protein 3-like [Centruroides sculpturatus]XP_023219796.1 patched domain-containing protein 3-like [Centruroides sculpturatus]